MAITSIGMLSTGSYSLLVLWALVNGMAWTFFPIIWTVPFELKDIKPREIAVAVGFQQTTMYFGSFVGPIMAGFIHQMSGDLHLGLVIPFCFSIFMSLGGILMPSNWDQASSTELKTAAK